MENPENITDTRCQALLRPISIIGTSLILLSLASLAVTIISYLSIAKLRQSVAGKMIISIATALFGHHGAALITSIYYVIFSCLEPVYLCILHASLYGYFGTVVIFLFAAEAAYTYAKIIRAVEDIENYVLKASLVAWITPLLLMGFTVGLLAADNRCPFVPLELLFGILLANLILLIFVWAVFIRVMVELCIQSHKSVALQKHSTSKLKEFKKNVVVLIILFSFLGLPFIVIIFGYAILDLIFNYIFFVINMSQGPILLLLMGVRLKEVRNLWKSWLCCCCVKLWREPTSSTETIEVRM